MSEGMTAALITAITALGGVVAYLYREIVDGKDRTAKCMEEHARADERANNMAERVKGLADDIRMLKTAKDNWQSAVDTKIEK